MHNIHKTLGTLIFIPSNLCASKWHAVYHIENTWQMKEATTDSRLDLKFVKLVISWALPSRQQHRVTSGRIAHSPFFHTSWKTPVRQSQGKWWIPVLTPVNIKANHKRVSKKDILIPTFTSLTITDKSVTAKVGNCFSQWRVCCLVRRGYSRSEPVETQGAN